jgi:4-diphosphocytidyl-2-C-methyl-D-erythritol kinase
VIPALSFSERAPAKVNLTLHVVGRRADGYHLLDSLVAFAAIADELTLEPGPALDLELRGPMAAAAGPVEDNLVVKATMMLAARLPGLAMGRFRLLKRLPVAAGLGGGSSDAAAALRLLARTNGLDADDPRLAAAAAATGADVPVCLAAQARRMAGAGEALSPPLVLPPLPAVLVNPGVRVLTTEVFRALALAPGSARQSPPHPTIPAGLPRQHLVEVLREARNDLEEAAIEIAPRIAEAIDRTRSSPDCRLARMSGSGATVFGLFGSARASAAAAKAICAAHPNWWVATTTIG